MQAKMSSADSDRELRRQEDALRSLYAEIMAYADEITPENAILIAKKYGIEIALFGLLIAGLAAHSRL